jgi:O-acetyl-ADP-ribose deacetylase (regulator of RNase III)
MFVNKQKKWRWEWGTDFSPIFHTHKEPELVDARILTFPLEVSSVGTDYSQATVAKLPRGAALITTSGDLAKQTRSLHMMTYKEMSRRENYCEIKWIIHAASGLYDLSNYHPTKKSVILSVQNSIILAEIRNIKSLAIPLVGGGFFLNLIKKTSPGITKEQLAEAIVKAAINQRNFANETLTIVFNDYNSNNFQNVLNKLKNDSNWNSKFNEDNTKAVEGDITDFNIHKCEAIVNAANCKVQFGEGISGIIGEKTGEEAEAINGEAREIINEYKRKQRSESERTEGQKRIEQKKNQNSPSPSEEGKEENNNIGNSHQVSAAETTRLETDLNLGDDDKNKNNLDNEEYLAEFKRREENILGIVDRVIVHQLILKNQNELYLWKHVAQLKPEIAFKYFTKNWNPEDIKTDPSDNKKKAFYEGNYYLSEQDKRVLLSGDINEALTNESDNKHWNPPLNDTEKALIKSSQTFQEIKNNKHKISSRRIFRSAGGKVADLPDNPENNDLIDSYCDRVPLFYNGANGKQESNGKYYNLGWTDPKEIKPLPRGCQINFTPENEETWVTYSLPKFEERELVKSWHEALNQDINGSNWNPPLSDQEKILFDFGNLNNEKNILKQVDEVKEARKLLTILRKIRGNKTLDEWTSSGNIKRDLNLTNSCAAHHNDLRNFHNSVLEAKPAETAAWQAINKNLNNVTTNILNHFDTKQNEPNNKILGKKPLIGITVFSAVVFLAIVTYRVIKDHKNKTNSEKRVP